MHRRAHPGERSVPDGGRAAPGRSPAPRRRRARPPPDSTTAAGRDASDEFDEIGHSKAAHKMLEDYRIGVVEAAKKGGASAAAAAAPPKAKETAASKAQKENLFIKVMQILLPVIILIAAPIVRQVTS